MYYAGIGSRKTPPNILRLMTRVAERLDALGYVLRSGGAKGADQAFEKGATHKEVFYAKDATPQATQLAQIHHPAWHRLPKYVKKLHGRNSMQIFGKNLDQPVLFVLCWTPDGSEGTTTPDTGGTGQAIRLVIVNNIPIFNLKKEGALDRLAELIKEHQKSF